MATLLYSLNGYSGKMKIYKILPLNGQFETINKTF